LSIRTKRNSRRFIAAAAAVAVAASSFIATSAGPAGATTAAAPSAERYSGDNRFATAAAVATSTLATAGCATDAAKATKACKTFADATAVVIVNGRSSANGADGLAAAALAGALNAPILLVEQDSIPAETLAALNALTTAPWGTALAPQVREFVVVGGTSAVSSSVLGELAALKTGITARRVAGADRYETAINVALAVSASATAKLGSKVILAVGDNWPDALAASALAYGGLRGAGTNVVSPILLNNGATLRSDVAAALQAMNSIDEVLVVGGTTVMPDAILTAIRGLKNANGGAIGAVRAGGANRYATAVAASASSSAFTTTAGVADATAVVLANGQNVVGPWDALSAGPLAGRLGAALLLTEAAAPPAATAAWHVAAASTLAKVYAVGGTTVISDAAATAAVGAATPTTPTQPTGALKLTNVTQASRALVTATSGNHATLSALASGSYAGVLGNGVSISAVVVPTSTAVGVTVTKSAGTLVPGSDVVILITGPNELAIGGTTLGQLKTLVDATGQFELAVAGTTALGSTVTSSAAIGHYFDGNWAKNGQLFGWWSDIRPTFLDIQHSSGFDSRIYRRSGLHEGRIYWCGYCRSLLADEHHDLLCHDFHLHNCSKN
jgi:putative cell wall-binding protein